jgi:hypothetical protein
MKWTTSGHRLKRDVSEGQSSKEEKRQPVLFVEGDPPSSSRGQGGGMGQGTGDNIHSWLNSLRIQEMR